MVDQQFAVFKTALLHSVFIILSPILTFFITKLVFFQRILGIETTTSNVWSAVFAVIVLHIALGSYIYKAYSGPPEVIAEKNDKQD